MRHLRSISAIVLALGLVLTAAGVALAKGDAVVSLDEPIPTDPKPGSTISIGWTLEMEDGAGGTVPLNSEGVFIRFTPRTGEPLEVMARQDREGHYRTTVTVPEGGLGSPVFGLKGEACFAGGGCQRSDILFPLASETRVVAPDPVAAPVTPAPVAPAPVAQQPAPAAVTTPTQTVPSPAAATVDLTALPLVALVGVAVAGLALFIRGRGRATAT